MRGGNDDDDEDEDEDNTNNRPITGVVRVHRKKREVTKHEYNK
jgi:hypothetical protein